MNRAEVRLPDGSKLRGRIRVEGGVATLTDRPTGQSVLWRVEGVTVTTVKAGKAWTLHEVAEGGSDGGDAAPALIASVSRGCSCRG